MSRKPKKIPVENPKIAPIRRLTYTKIQSPNSQEIETANEHVIRTITYTVLPEKPKIVQEKEKKSGDKIKGGLKKPKPCPGHTEVVQRLVNKTLKNCPVEIDVNLVDKSKGGVDNKAFSPFLPIRWLKMAPQCLEMGARKMLIYAAKTEQDGNKNLNHQDTDDVKLTHLRSGKERNENEELTKTPPTGTGEISAVPSRQKSKKPKPIEKKKPQRAVRSIKEEKGVNKEKRLSNKKSNRLGSEAARRLSSGDTKPINAVKRRINAMIKEDNIRNELRMMRSKESSLNRGEKKVSEEDRQRQNEQLRKTSKEERPIIQNIIQQNSGVNKMGEFRRSIGMIDKRPPIERSSEQKKIQNEDKRLSRLSNEEKPIIQNVIQKNPGGGVRNIEEIRQSVKWEDGNENGKLKEERRVDFGAKLGRSEDERFVRGGFEGQRLSGGTDEDQNDDQGVYHRQGEDQGQSRVSQNRRSSEEERPIIQNMIQKDPSGDSRKMGGIRQIKKNEPVQNQEKSLGSDKKSEGGRYDHTFVKKASEDDDRKRINENSDDKRFEDSERSRENNTVTENKVVETQNQFRIQRMVNDNGVNKTEGRRRSTEDKTSTKTTQSLEQLRRSIEIEQTDYRLFKSRFIESGLRKHRSDESRLHLTALYQKLNKPKDDEGDGVSPLLPKVTSDMVKPLDVKPEEKVPEPSEEEKIVISEDLTGEEDMSVESIIDIDLRKLMEFANKTFVIPIRSAEANKDLNKEIMEKSTDESLDRDKVEEESIEETTEESNTDQELQEISFESKRLLKKMTRCRACCKDVANEECRRIIKEIVEDAVARAELKKRRRSDDERRNCLNTKCGCENRLVQTEERTSHRTELVEKKEVSTFREDIAQKRRRDMCGYVKRLLHSLVQDAVEISDESEIECKGCDDTSGNLGSGDDKVLEKMKKHKQVVVNEEIGDKGLKKQLDTIIEYDEDFEQAEKACDTSDLDYDLAEEDEEEETVERSNCSCQNEESYFEYANFFIGEDCGVGTEDLRFQSDTSDEEPLQFEETCCCEESEEDNEDICLEQQYFYEEDMACGTSDTDFNIDTEQSEDCDGEDFSEQEKSIGTRSDMEFSEHDFVETSKDVPDKEQAVGTASDMELSEHESDLVDVPKDVVTVPEKEQAIGTSSDIDFSEHESDSTLNKVEPDVKVVIETANEKERELNVTHCECQESAKNMNEVIVMCALKTQIKGVSKEVFYECFEGKQKKKDKKQLEKICSVRYSKRDLNRPSAILKLFRFFQIKKIKGKK